MVNLHQNISLSSHRERACLRRRSRRRGRRRRGRRGGGRLIPCTSLPSRWSARWRECSDTSWWTSCSPTPPCWTTWTSCSRATWPAAWCSTTRRTSSRSRRQTSPRWTAETPGTTHAVSYFSHCKLYQTRPEYSIVAKDRFDNGLTDCIYMKNFYFW